MQGLLKRVMRKYAQGELELAPVPTAPNPPPDIFQPWEICMTMNKNWAYNPADEDWKSPNDLIGNLVKIASQGGNYLLNVGPGPDGTLPPQAVERLQRIGEWVKVYGEAIYGSTYAGLPGTTHGCYTAKEGVLYYHRFNWPCDGRIQLDNLPTTVSRVTLLDSGDSLPFRLRDGRLTVEVPRQPPHPAVSVLAVHP